MKLNDMITRAASIVAVSLALVCGGAATSSAQMTPVLKPSIEITGAYVLVADMFDHAGSLGGIRLFRAPQPGAAGTVNAERLARIVQRHGLNWDNPNRLHHVRVARSGHLISEDELRDLIASRLHERIQRASDDQSFQVSFTSNQEPLYVAADKIPEADVLSIRYSRRSGTFEAIVSAPAGDPAARRFTYTGRAIEVRPVPVLLHAVRRGSVITEADIETRNVPVRRLDNTTVTDAADLIGMAARRSLRAGQPVREKDLERPRLVRRNNTVTVEYRSGGLVLTIRALATEAGAMGDIINIRNQSSNRVFEGKVIGPDRVQAIVTSAHLVASTN